MSGDDRRKWDARYAAGEHVAGEPSPFLRRLAPRLPPRGRALDVAGGTGRNALWLAERGYDVTIADISEVGLALARERAAARGLTLQTVAVDLADEGLPDGPWDVIVSILYLERALFGDFARVLAPGGLLVFLHPTVDNLARHPKPPRPFLLPRGALATWLADTGLEVLELDESWSDDGFHEARLLARRPAG